MREVQVYYGQDAMGQWSARITGAFDAQLKGKSPQAAREEVEDALYSHGVHAPYKSMRDSSTGGGETICYA